jgi:hypothetical protein
VERLAYAVRVVALVGVQPTGSDRRHVGVEIVGEDRRLAITGGRVLLKVSINSKHL